MLIQAKLSFFFFFGIITQNIFYPKVLFNPSEQLEASARVFLRKLKLASTG